MPTRGRTTTEPARADRERARHWRSPLPAALLALLGGATLLATACTPNSPSSSASPAATRPAGATAPASTAAAVTPPPATAVVAARSGAPTSPPAASVTPGPAAATPAAGARPSPTALPPTRALPPGVEVTIVVNPAGGTPQIRATPVPTLTLPPFVTATPDPNASPRPARELLPDPTAIPTEFQTVDADGTTVRLSEFRGKPVFLLFVIREGCPICTEVVPRLQGYVAGPMNGDGVVLVVLPQASPSQVKQWAAEASLSGRFLLDRDLTIVRQYRVVGVPALVMLDREGRYVSVLNGSFTDRDLEQFVKKLPSG